MENGLNNILSACLTIVMACYMGLFLKCRNLRAEIASLRDADVRTDTLLIYDTITREKPVFVRSEVVRHDTVYIELNNYYHDTVRVELPIERKVYGDSTYKAVVTGYDAVLESIEVYRPTRYITTEITRVDRPGPWSFGVTAGPSVLMTPKGSVYAGLGASVGITYRF